MCIVLALSTTVHAQTISLDGYTFEKYNRGFLNEVKIMVHDESQKLVGEAFSDFLVLDSRLTIKYI
jgi:hypothetical protein